MFVQNNIGSHWYVSSLVGSEKMHTIKIKRGLLSQRGPNKSKIQNIVDFMESMKFCLKNQHEEKLILTSGFAK